MIASVSDKLAQLSSPAVVEPPRPVPFKDTLSGPHVSREEFAFERVSPDHPLWILFSSGTTGLPKAIVHGHGGMILEHLKANALHLDLKPESCRFFYTTTGWMMWNGLICSLMSGCSIVLYDGSPFHPGKDQLWKIAAEAGVTNFGASPAFVAGMQKEGIRPRDLFDLSRLDGVFLSGAPASAETFEWFYDAVKTDLWVTSQSGGTEFCGGLVGSVPLLPVYAGEIQAKLLGVAVEARDKKLRSHRRGRRTRRHEADAVDASSLLERRR